MRHIELTPVNTYATKANAIKAVEKKYGTNGESRFFIMQSDDGRFFPVFCGMQALNEGVHFNFNVVA